MEGNFLGELGELAHHDVIGTKRVSGTYHGDFFLNDWVERPWNEGLTIMHLRYEALFSRL